MKIPASSFDVNLNDLLNRLNHNNSLANANAIIKKAWNDTQEQYNKAHNEIATVETQYKKDLSDTNNDTVKYVNTQINETKNGFNSKNKDLDKKLQKDINTAHTNIKNWVNGQKFLTPQQVNDNYNKLWGHITFRGKPVNNPQEMIDAVWAEDNAVSTAIINEHKAAQNFVKEQISDTMKGDVKNQFDSMRNHLPHNFMSYITSGQELPKDATPGDICWKADSYDTFSNNATAYQYNANGGWLPMKTQLDLYASNIYSPNIHGGAITGAEFMSQYYGRDGQSVFSVDQTGDIYAHNLFMDLNTYTTSTAVNRMVYNGNTSEAKGLNFNNGIMTMKAQALQNTGTPVRGYNGAIGGSNNADYVGVFNAYTYLEPDYLKLRGATNGADKQTLIGRTDLRGGNLELSDQWSQNWGVRLGYWNDGTGDLGPLLAIENGVKLGYYKDSNQPEFDLGDWQFKESGKGKLWVQPIENGACEINLKAPVNIHGSIFIDNDPYVKDANYQNEVKAINNGFSEKQRTLERHNKWLSNHAQVLSTGGNIDIDGKGTTFLPTRLDDHDGRISTTEEILRDNGGNLSTYQNSVKDLQIALASCLQISVDNHNGIDFYNLKNGKFNFTDDVAITNGGSLLMGNFTSMRSPYYTEIDQGDIFTNNLSTNHVNTGYDVEIADKLNLACGSDNQLCTNGNPLATRRWVCENFVVKKGKHPENDVYTAY